MFSAEERLASFSVASSSTSTATAKKRQSTKASSQWPHPVTGRSAKTSTIPSPATLAEHGFFHTPSQDELDAVSHFLYPDVHIANWQPNDDPLSRLEEALPGNGWCRIFRSQKAASLDDATNKWTWQLAELLPTSKEMTQARKETFGSQWPYDGKKGWKPTSKKLAEAGFYFAPTDEEPDNAKCIYCSKSLGGWEKADDPVHEHQRRVPDCAFFNCELREPPTAPTPEEQVDDAHDDEIEPVEVPKKGGKRAVSTTRKASAKIAKGKKSTAAKKHEEEDMDGSADQQDDVEPTEAKASVTEEAAAEEKDDEVVAPNKKGGRKTRSVSTKKLAAKAPVEEEESKEDEPAEEAEVEPAVEQPTQTLSKKKSAAGLGNGIASQTTAARPTRAASRRATKAINLLSDEGLNRKLRRPDEEDLEKRELALSDPVPFPTAQSDDIPMPATDPIQPTKPKKSRSKPKKLDQELTAATPKEPAPEPEVETPIEEDAVRGAEDNTIIEHEDDEESVEEPKRRGGRAAKATSTKASASKVSTSSAKSRKASAKVTAVEAEEADQEAAATPAAAVDAVEFPSMSSEADPEPAHKRSSSALSKSSASAKDAQPTTSSRKPSTSSSSKRGSSNPTPLASELDTPPASSDDSDAHLPNTGSQATIRGAPRSSSVAAALNTGRSPLSHLPQLTSLDLDDAQRAMTLGEWLQAKAEAAAIEMRAEGEAQLADLENQFRVGRGAVERRLRGRA